MRVRAWFVVLVVALVAHQGCARKEPAASKAVTAAVARTEAAVAVAKTETAAAVGEVAKSPVPKENLEIPADMKTCAANFAKIHAAIKTYQKDKGKMPDWLSDLVPGYLSAEALACPSDSEKRAAYFPDPKLPCSYGYEFSPTRYGDNAGVLSGKTASEWKTAQMKLFGDVVPVVRCHHHGDNTLNLGYGGRVYSSQLVWETLFNPDYQLGSEFQGTK